MSIAENRTQSAERTADVRQWCRTRCALPIALLSLSLPISFALWYTPKQSFERSANPTNQRPRTKAPNQHILTEYATTTTTRIEYHFSLDRRTNQTSAFDQNRHTFALLDIRQAVHIFSVQYPEQIIKYKHGWTWSRRWTRSAVTAAAKGGRTWQHSGAPAVWGKSKRVARLSGTKCAISF